MTDPTPWLDADEQLLWRRWLRAHRQLADALGRQLATESGLSMPDYQVLVVLSEAPEDRMRVAELANCLQWERSRLSHHLTRMEKRDLVRREECPTDRRGAYLVLTAHGRSTVEEAAPGHVRAVRSLFLDQLSPADREALSRITSTITTANGGCAP